MRWLSASLQAPADAQVGQGAPEARGLPRVLNVVVGNGREVGGELAANPGVVALSFSGSYGIGRQIYLQLARRMARRNGFFMQPTVLSNVKPNMRIAREEVFGPVIAIIPVENFDEAIAVANGVDVGLSASHRTRAISRRPCSTPSGSKPAW